MIVKPHIIKVKGKAELTAKTQRAQRKTKIQVKKRKTKEQKALLTAPRTKSVEDKKSAEK